MPTVKYYNQGYEIGLRCEICGKWTSDVNKHICSECAKRLNKLLYEKGKDE